MDGQLTALPKDNQQQPILECHSNCNCRAGICTNRVVGSGNNPTNHVLENLSIYNTLNKGQGLRTEIFIPQLTFVCEYLGEIITAQEATRRLSSSRDAMNYLITVTEHFSTCKSQTFIDSRHFGNVSRYINHSCAPNLVGVVVRVGSDVPRLGLFALRDIPAGEELTFNYASECSLVSTTPCLCGAKCCKGFLPFDTIAS